DVLDRVLFAKHLIVEAHLAIVEPNIRYREPHRFAGGGGSGCRRGGAFHQVGKIEALFGGPDDVNRRPVDSDFADNRSEPEQRGPRSSDAHMADIDKGPGRIAIADMQLFKVEPERVQVESNPANAGGAMERRGDLHPYDMAEQDRYAEIRQHLQREGRYHGDLAGRAHPPRAENFDSTGEPHIGTRTPV